MPPMPVTVEPLPKGTTGSPGPAGLTGAATICADRFPPPRMATAMSGEPGSDRTAAPAVRARARALPASTSEKGAPTVRAVGRGVVSTPTTSGAEVAAGVAGVAGVEDEEIGSMVALAGWGWSRWAGASARLPFALPSAASRRSCVNSQRRQTRAARRTR